MHLNENALVVARSFVNPGMGPVQIKSTGRSALRQVIGIRYMP